MNWKGVLVVFLGLCVVGVVILGFVLELGCVEIGECDVTMTGGGPSRVCECERYFWEAEE